VTPVAPPVTVPPLGPITKFEGSSLERSVTLTWNAVTGATKYELKRNNSIVYTGTNLAYTDIDVTPGTTYSYELKALNTSGASISAIIEISTKKEVPKAPTNFKSTPASTSMLLTWDTIFGAEKYELSRNGKIVYVGEINQYKDSSLIPATTYNYSLKALNSAGSSNSTILSVSTLKVKPASITGLKATPTEKQVSLSWSKVEFAEYYTVKVNGKVLYKGANISFTHKNLKANTNYVYSVIAGNSVGESNAKSISITTKQIPTKTSITPSKSVYKKNETIELTIKVTDNNKAPISSANVTTVITDPKGKTTSYYGKTNKSGVLVVKIKTSKSSQVGIFQVNTNAKFTAKDIYINSNASKSFQFK
jgi:hypothetical protein